MKLGREGNATKLVCCQLGRHNIDHDPCASFETGGCDQLREQVYMPVIRTVVVMRRGVKDQVVRHIAMKSSKMFECVTNADSDGTQRGVGAVGEMQIVATGHDEQFVRRAAPVRADTNHIVVGEQHSLAVDQFGFDGCAQNTATFESAECSLLVQDFAWNKWQSKQLSVRVCE